MKPKKQNIAIERPPAGRCQVSPDAQRIAIAEACGWVNCILPIQDEYHFLTDLELGRAMGKPVGRNFSLHRDGCHHSLPDYLNDLNAMHEAELTLTTDQRIDQAEWLGACGDELPTKSWVILLRATATQRAEAFLKTIGRWKE